MDMGSLLKMGASMFIQSKLSGDNGSGLDSDMLSSALSSLTGDSEEGGLDISSIASNMMSGDSDLGGLVSSWLGDGDNESPSAEQVTDILGEDKISAFAEKLGLSQEEAVGGLQEALPEMVNQASEGGSLLDSIGGIEGAIGMASNLFGNK